MSRYILQSDGTSSYTASDVAEKAEALAGVTVVDQSSPNILLVDAPDEVMQQLSEALPGWSASPERMIPLTDTRPRPR